MDVYEWDNWPDFAQAQASNWRRVCAASPRATVFQTWEWCETWWEFQGRNKRLWALAFSENGQTVGFAALFFSKIPGPLRTVRFVGTGGSDYLDIVALPGYESAVSQAFADALIQNKRRWDWADLQQVRPGSVLDVWQDAAPVGLRPTFWAGETCPYLPLPSDWETFRKSLKKKLRSNIGYYERGLEKQYQVEYRIADNETLADDMDAFFNLHQRRWNQRWLPGAFASRQARKWHETVAKKLLAAGMLRLHTITLDGQIEAALYCFQKGAMCSYYLGGFEPTLAKLSLGTVLTARAIRYAIEADGATEFDLLRGNEGYKYKWGAIDRFNRRVSVKRPGFVRPHLLASGGRTQLAIEHHMKEWMHKKHGGAGSGSHD